PGGSDPGSGVAGRRSGSAIARRADAPGGRARSHRHGHGEHVVAPDRGEARARMTRALRRRVVLAAAVLAGATGAHLSAPGSAWAYYTLTPVCTSGGASAPCSASWYTSQVWVSW